MTTFYFFGQAVYNEPLLLCGNMKKSTAMSLSKYNATAFGEHIVANYIITMIYYLCPMTINHKKSLLCVCGHWNVRQQVISRHYSKLCLSVHIFLYKAFSCIVPCKKDHIVTFWVLSSFGLLLCLSLSLLVSVRLVVCHVLPLVFPGYVFVFMFTFDLSPYTPWVCLTFRLLPGLTQFQ